MGRRKNDGPHVRRNLVPCHGTGKPQKPDGLPVDVALCWERFASLCESVACEQDSLAIEQGARLMWRQSRIEELLQADPLNESLNRISLALGRALLSLMDKFAMTPKSRASFLVNGDEPDDRDEFEKMLDERDG